MVKHLLPKRERYFKTALHVHTDVSDGFWSPEALKACFKEHGFSCVAFSDHNLITDQSQLNDEDFLTLTSYEMGFSEKNKGWYAKTIHINVLAKEPHHLWQAANPPSLYKRSEEFIDKAEIVDKNYECTPEDINAFIAETNKQGFLCTYNHPCNNMLYTGEDMALTGMWGIEVFNNDANLCGQPNYYDEKFQRFLMQGQRVFPIMSDDCHSKKSFRGYGMWVGAKELTYESMIEALEKGDFYSTAGPEIYSLTLDDEHKLHVSCSEVVYGSIQSHSNFTQAQPPFSNGTPTTELTFDLTRWFDGCVKTDAEKERAFIRLVLIDAQGRRAYTRAYWWDDLT